MPTMADMRVQNHDNKLGNIRCFPLRLYYHVAFCLFSQACSGTSALSTVKKKRFKEFSDIIRKTVFAQVRSVPKFL